MLRSRISVLCAAAAGSLLLATTAHALTVGEQVELTGSPLGTAEQRKPVAVYDPASGVYVVAFEDYSNASTNFSDVIVTRVRLDVLDGTDGKLDGDLIIDDPEGVGLPLGVNLEQRQTTPAVAFNDVNNSVAVIWTDDRNGDTDIRGSRFLASIGQFFGDVDISDGSSLNETQPDVVWAQNTYLVAYRQLEVSTGQFDVLGRRFFDDLSDFDPDPLNLNRSRQGGAPALTNLGNQFVIAFAGGGEVWASTLGDLATTGTSTPTQVSTSTTSETDVDVAPIGPAQISVVWRQRNATSDIFADRLSATLTSVGPSDFVTTAPNNQLIPKVAGDVNGALAVWQDFRRGTGSPQVYGARFDSNGNLRDPLAFPLIVLPAGAFEQNVVKGPNNDYLVFGVSRQVNAGLPEERIFVRLVRDEAPASTMTNEGEEEAPADGETPMRVTFGPAAGPEPMAGIEGLDVADGTLYTVEWTSANVSAVQITPPDADRDPMNGHQVQALDGSVAFELTSCVMFDAMDNCIQADKGTVDLTVSSVEGTSMGTGQVEFLNVAPVASNVVVLGVNSMDTNPTTSDELVLTYDYFDINADQEMGTEVIWQRGDPVADQQATSFSGPLNQPNRGVLRIPASALQKGGTRKCQEGNDQGLRGDAWAGFIVPNDGDASDPGPVREPPPGAMNPTNVIVLRNSPPFVRNAEVCPAEGMNCLEPDVRTEEGIRANFSADDPDGIDDVEAEQISWSVQQPGAADFEPVDLGGPTVEQVPPSLVVSGQIWKYTVSVTDGCDGSGTLTESSTLTINNSGPTAVAQGPEEVSERSMVTVDGTGSFDPDPNDTLTYQWVQTGGTMIEFDDDTSPMPSFTAPSTVLGTSLVFELTVSDGNPLPEDEMERRRRTTTLAIQVRDLPNSDGDDLDDELEMMVGTDPMDTDTDGDTLRDDEEVDPFTGAIIVNPTDADADDDGIQDGDEGRRRFGELEGADPFADPDGDGLINALDPDSDNDLIPDGIEAARTRGVEGGMSTGGVAYAGTEGEFVGDADSRTQTSPVDPDDDGDGFEDGEEDSNQNGRVDEGESDPNDPNDPSGGCSNDEQCGDDEVCDTASSMCVPASSVCTGDTLAEQGFECCVDADTPPEAEVCRNERWTCPTTSRQRNVGFCSEEDRDPVESGGCRSLTAEGSSPFALLLLGLAGLFIRRRRR